MTFTAPRSTSSVKVEPIKRGRRLYGGVHTVKATGQSCYLAYRRQGEIFRYGEKSISDAVRLGKAAWAIDEEDLINMRVRGVTLIGVLVRETGDLYLTHIDNFFDRSKAQLLNYESRGGALQRYLPLQYFKIRHGRVKLKSR